MNSYGGGFRNNVPSSIDLAYVIDKPVMYFHAGVWKRGKDGLKTGCGMCKLSLYSPCGSREIWKLWIITG